MDFFEIVRLLLPSFLRKPVQQSWLRALLSPLQTLFNDQVKPFLIEQRIQLKLSSQVLVLETYLNDVFDPINRGIWIAHVLYDPDAIWFRSEGQSDTFLGFRSEALTDQFFKFRSETTSAIAVDFIIYVPSYLTGQLDQIRAVIDSVKLAGKTYQIIIVEDGVADIPLTPEE